jgi:Flp pilus assembly protein TadD
MTPAEERLYAKYEKCRVLTVGFNGPEFKQLKGWFIEKRNKNLTEMSDAAAVWEKLNLASFHFVVLKIDNDENEDLLAKLVDSKRFQRTPIIAFSRSPEVYTNSYAKRDMIGRFCKLPINLNEFEKIMVALLTQGVVEASATKAGTGSLLNFTNGCKALEEGRLAEAKEELRLCLKEDPKFFDAYLKMGETLIALGEHDTALRVLQRANEIQPDNSRTFFLLGQAELEKGDPVKAMAEFDKAVALEPKNVKLLMDIGNAFLAKNMIEEALKYFNMARELSPDFLNVYNRMGITFSRAGRFDEAETMYNKALELDKEDPGVYFNLGMMWSRKGDKEKAKEKFKKCLELNPQMDAAKEMLTKL